MDENQTIDAILGVLTNAANQAVAARYQHPFELQKMKIEAISNGRMFQEGYPAYGVTSGAGGVPWLLVGAVLVVGMLVLKD